MNEPGSTGAATAPDPKASATGFVTEGDFYRWNLPARSARLELHSDVIHIIEGDVHRKAATERRDEFGGLLFGHSNAATYRIIGFEQCRCQSDGLHRVLAVWSHRLLASAQQQPLPPAGGSLLGFYRIICLEEELELSRVDLNLTESYFASPGGIVLLISYAGSTARVFYRTEHGLGSDLLNFPVSVGSLAVHEVTAPSESRQPDAHLPAFPITFGENEFEYNEVESEPLHENFGRRRLDPRLAVAIVAVLVIVLAVWLRRPVQSDQFTARSESSIGLEVQRSTSGLMLKWNPASSEISSAKVGLVTIQDGENQQELPLDKDQLMAGRLFYPPLSEMVRFTLQIFTENGVQRGYAAAIVPSNGESRSATDQPQFEVPLRSATRVLAHKPAAANQAGTGTPKAETSEARAFAAAPAESIPPATPAAPVEVPPPVQNAAVDPPSLSDPVKQPDTPTADRAQITSPPLVIERMTALPQVPPRPAEPDVPPPAAEPLEANTPPRPVEPPVPGAYVPPQPIRQTKPVVPRNLHTLISREILVEVNLTIDADGSIVRAEASPGEGPLNRSLARLAVATARLWKFKPAREGNRSVPGEIQIQFQFSPGP